MIFKGLNLKGIFGREMFETWYKMSQIIRSGVDVSPSSRTASRRAVRGGVPDRPLRSVREGDSGVGVNGKGEWVNG